MISDFINKKKIIISQKTLTLHGEIGNHNFQEYIQNHPIIVPKLKIIPNNNKINRSTCSNALCDTCYSDTCQSSVAILCTMINVK